MSGSHSLQQSPSRLGSKYTYSNIGSKSGRREIDLPQEPEKKFLVLPSFCAGVCLGLNNFLLGMISDTGIPAAYIFSVGSLLFPLTYRIV